MKIISLMNILLDYTPIGWEPSDDYQYYTTEKENIKYPFKKGDKAECLKGNKEISTGQKCMVVELYYGYIKKTWCQFYEQWILKVKFLDSCNSCGDRHYKTVAHSASCFMIDTNEERERRKKLKEKEQRKIEREKRKQEKSDALLNRWMNLGK